MTDAPLTDAVRATWPDVTWDDVSSPPRGLDHDVAVLHGAALGGDPVPGGAVVARRATSPGVRGRAGLEAAVLAELGPRMPDGVRLARALRHDGADLTLQSFVPGEPLDAAAVADAGLPAMAARISAALSVFHRAGITAAPFDAVGGSWFPEKAATVRERCERHLLPRLDDGARRGVARILDRADEAFDADPAPAHLVHGDVNASHLLWDGTTLGVIDVSDMTVADAAFDVAHLDDVAPGLRDAVIGGLADRDPRVTAASLRERAARYAAWDAVFLACDAAAGGHADAAKARRLLDAALRGAVGGGDRRQANHSVGGPAMSSSPNTTATPSSVTIAMDSG
ncbi:aminoglycoside phosphotransferase family protein [Corynebacterium sp. 335C]